MLWSTGAQRVRHDSATELNRPVRQARALITQRRQHARRWRPVVVALTQTLLRPSFPSFPHLDPGETHRTCGHFQG